MLGTVRPLHLARLLAPRSHRGYAGHSLRGASPCAHTGGFQAINAVVTKQIREMVLPLARALVDARAAAALGTAGGLSTSTIDFTSQVAGLHAQFDYLEYAFQYYMLVVKARIMSLGPQHPDSLSALMDLGTVRRRTLAATGRSSR